MLLVSLMLKLLVLKLMTEWAPVADKASVLCVLCDDRHNEITINFSELHCTHTHIHIEYSCTVLKILYTCKC